MAKQINLTIEDGVSANFESLREFVQHCVHTNPTLNKVIAMDMDLSPSHLSRKLAGNPNDTMDLTCRDLENYIDVSGDVKPVYYLVDKYLNKSIDELAEENERLRLENERLKARQ